MVDTLVFLVAGDNLVLLEEFFHRVCLFSGGEVFDGLPHFRVVQRFLLDGEDAEACRVLELAPEVLQEILEHAGVAVDFEEGIAVLPVRRHCFVPAVLVEFADCLEEQLHLVEDKDDVTHLLVLGGLRFEGLAPHVFLCHNFDFLTLITVVVSANI